jgi:hypothetical protein
MALKQVQTLFYTDGFPITASDTVDVSGDANNTKGYTFVYLQNVAAGATCRVMTVDGTTLTIYLPQGQIVPLAVKRVFATTPTPPAGLIGLVGKQSI